MIKHNKLSLCGHVLIYSWKSKLKQTMDDIPYSRIRVIYVLRPCAVGFALRNVRDIFLKKMATGGVQYFCCLP